jgi:uncharacterized protein YjiS (DUF1127 family)
MRMTKTSEAFAMTTAPVDSFDHQTNFAPYWPVRRHPGVLAIWLDRQRQRVHLSRLDDRLLDDIGVGPRAAFIEPRRWT